MAAGFKVNGEAIFGTRPWVTAEANTKEEIPVRFTQKDDAVYAILLGDPTWRKITIESLQVGDNTTIHLLGHDGTLEWQQQDNNLTVMLPEMLKSTPAHTSENYTTPCD